MQIKKFIRIEDCYFDVMEVIAVTFVESKYANGQICYVLKIHLQGSHVCEIPCGSSYEVRKLFLNTVAEIEQALKDIAEIS